MCAMYAEGSPSHYRNGGMVACQNRNASNFMVERMEGADAAPRFLEGLLEAMLQSCYDRFGGLSKLTKGVHGRRGWTDAHQNRDA